MINDDEIVRMYGKDYKKSTIINTALSLELILDTMGAETKKAKNKRSLYFRVYSMIFGIWYKLNQERIKLFFEMLKGD